ncbi:MAG: metallophosphoesterase [Phycisphaerae bacterium]|nr:metallophosphoesterase [Phycisphaerae bacterium]
MKRAAIVVIPAAIVALLGCRANQPQPPVEQGLQSGVMLPQQELAADRPMPKRTNATRERITPPESDAPEQKTPLEAARPDKPAETPKALPAAKPEPVRRPASQPVAPTPTSTPSAQPEVAPVKAPAPKDAEEDGAMVLVPSQGRPAMISPGDTFYFVMRLRRALGQRILVWLVHSRVPELRYGLRADVKLGIVDGRYGQMILKVPDNVAPGLYDLEIQGESRSYFSRHCVKVMSTFSDRFRFIHLSNMNIDDPAAPEFDDLLIEEINILDPAFVVCTGDFTEWGRALGDPNDWVRTLKFLAKIQAPTYIVCGDHDHEESFDRYVADNPIGTFDYGNYHGILMLDHSAHRLDSEQLKWLKTELANHRNLRGFNFIVMHNDELDVLDMLRREVPDLPGYVKDHKLRMIVTGGHIDWDLREFAAKLKGLQDDGSLIYIRTHQSSTCMHDRATGISHYRVIEVDGQDVEYIYRDDTGTTVGQHSIPVGRLRVFYSHPNDGSQERVIATVQNALNQEFKDCRVWVRVAKSLEASPAVAGGKLVCVLDGKTYWMCEVAVDLPDKGGVKVMVANKPALLPEPMPLSMAMNGGKNGTTQPATAASSRSLVFTKQTADVGLTYYRCQEKVSVSVTNKSQAAQEVWPVVRLNGEMIPIDWSAVPGERKPLVIQAGQSVVLPLKLVLGRMSPGPHQLQVFFRSDPLKRVSSFPVFLTLAKQ